MDETVMKTRKQYFNTGFIAGLAAGLFATGGMLLLNVLVGGVSLPEVLGSKLTALMSPSLFEYLHQTIGADAKRYLFDGIVVGQCLVFALSGGLYMFTLVSYRPFMLKEPTTKLRSYHGLLLALILWLFSGLIFLPLSDAGVFGSQLSIGLTSTTLSLALVGAIFGLLFVPIFNWLAVRPTEDTPDKQASVLARRTFIKQGF